MKYVVFSDIHGNADVLRNLLEKEIAGSDTGFIFCGDVCGYYYETRECIDLLRGIKGLIAVRGNHDQYYMDAFDEPVMTEKLVKKYGSSYGEKDKVIRDYLSSLPLVETINCNGRIIRIQHGTPEDPLEGRLYPDTPLPDIEGGNVFITGHTHYQMYRNSGESIWLNPGSIGQPRDGKDFSYCKLDTENWNIQFCSINMDIRRLIQRIRMNDPEDKYLEGILCRNK